MDVSYKSAINYKRKVDSVEAELKNETHSNNDDQIKSLSQQLQSNRTDSKVKSMPNNVIVSLNNNEGRQYETSKIFSMETLKILTKNKLFNDDSVESLTLASNNLKETINNNIFPEIGKNEGSEAEQKLLNAIYISIKSSEKKIKLQKEYSPIINRLKESLATVNDKDTNKFMRLFQKNSTKKKVEEAKTYIKSEYYQVDILEKELAFFERITPNALEVRRDFNMNPIKYYDVIRRQLNYDQDAPNKMTELIKDKVSEIKRSLDKKNATQLDEKIFESWNQLKATQLPEELGTIPIDTIQATTDIVLPINELINANINTVGDIYYTSVENIMEITTLTQAQSEKVFETTNNFVEGLEEHFYPRLNPNDFTESEYELLRLIHHRQQLGTTEEKIINDAETLLNHIQEQIDYLKTNDSNDYQRLFYNDDIKQKIKQSKEELNNNFNQLLIAIKELDNIKIEELSNRGLKNDFQINSAGYYAVIDRVTGSTKTYSPNDLPSYIVEEVNEMTLETEGLKGTLRPYQEFGAKYALYYKRTLLGDEMGLGKTIQAIAVINHLRQKGKKHTVVVSPLSVLVNWKREIDKWSDIKSFLFRGKDRKDALKTWVKDGGILLTNYEQTRHLLESEKVEKLDFLIVDEAHYIKKS